MSPGAAQGRAEPRGDDFSTLGTLCDLFLRRAGSLTRLANRLTLTIAASGPARKGIEHFT